jgi:hypothetical protein
MRFHILVYSGTTGTWRHEVGLSTPPIAVLILNGLPWNAVVAYIGFGVGVTLVTWRKRARNDTN